MVLDGGVGAATAVGSAVNISLRLFQVIYEFKAVGQQTRDLLDSTKHVSSTLESARVMRQQKSLFLSADERRWIDSIIIDTKRCLENVAALVEPARVDLQTKSGRVGFLNRGLFVFRDSPKVATNLARLNLAHQSLNAAMGVLCSKGVSWQPTGELQAVIQQDLVSPPSYEKDQFIHRGKLPRTGSVSTFRNQQHPQKQPILLSDDGEELLTHAKPRNYPHATELECRELPVEITSGVIIPAKRPDEWSKDFEGLQVVEHLWSHQSELAEQRPQGYQMAANNAHNQCATIENSGELQSYSVPRAEALSAQVPLRARSKGRAWLESRSMRQL